MIQYAHGYKKKVYVTLNTIIFDSQLEDVLDYVDQLVAMNVDALIIQDLGIMHALHQCYPELELHASTQMNVGNSSAIKLVEHYGVKRVVLPRETTLAALKLINDATAVEIELFVQGALCTSYSGQCFFSFYRQDGSGNLGSCGQHCRKKMSIHKDPQEYALSLRDLSLQEDVLSLEGLVDSLKIEGRLKSKEYLYGCVSYYRTLLDTGYSDETMLDFMKIAFNRTYTKGLLKGQNGKLINNSIRINNHGLEVGVVSKIEDQWIHLSTHKVVHRLDNLRIIHLDNECGLVVEKIMQNNQVVDSANGQFKIKRTKTVPVGGKVYVTKTQHVDELERMSKPFIKRQEKLIEIEALCGQPLKVKVDDTWYQSEWSIEPAKSAPMTQEAIIQQLSKTQDTPFQFICNSITMDDSIFMVKSLMNQFKRSVIDSLLKEPQPLEKQSIQPIILNKESFKDYLFGVSNLEQALVLKEFNIDCVYALDLSLLEQLKSVFNQVIPVLPRVIKEHQMTTYLALIEGFKTVMVSDLGMLKLLKDTGIELHASFSFHATNRFVVDWLKGQGVTRIVQSLESQDEIGIKGVEMIRYAYGRVPLMIMDYCPINENKKDTCGDCRKCRVSQYHLYDEKKRAYPLIHTGEDLLEIFSDQPLRLLNKKPTSSYDMLWLYDETKEEIYSLLKQLKKN